MLWHIAIDECGGSLHFMTEGKTLILPERNKSGSFSVARDGDCVSITMEKTL